MSQLDQTRTQDLPEVVRVAVEMQEAEEARGREQRSVAAAAQEMGVDPAYLDRAAAEVQAAQVQAARRARRRRMGLGIAAGLASVAACAVGLWWLARPTGPAPVYYAFGDPASAAWLLETAGATARVSFTGPRGLRGAAITVDQMRMETGPEPYVVDLSTDQAPPRLDRYRSVSFRVRGTGLPQVRLFLEKGNQRWCSPFLTAAGNWHTQSVPLSSFVYQTRPSPAYNWSDQPRQPIGAVGAITFKLGAHANPVSARGQVELADLEFR